MTLYRVTDTNTEIIVPEKPRHNLPYYRWQMSDRATREAIQLAHEWRSRHPRTARVPQWVRAALAIEGTPNLIDGDSWSRAITWELSADRGWG